MPSDEWDFRCATKLSGLSYRTVESGETLATLQACAPQIPITRVSDLTPLDRLRLPVFSATTPLARDLTTHMGKGLNADSARLSAMMEAVERVSAEQVDRPLRRGSFRKMLDHAPAVVDPRLFDLPSDSTFTNDRQISWIDAWDLVAGETVWLPLDLAINPPHEGVLRQVDTNGLAAGNTMLEAVVHALCEVIERDALGIRLFRHLYMDADESPVGGRRIDPRGLDSVGGAWLERITANGLALVTEILDSDSGVPVFRSVLIDHAYPGGTKGHPRAFVGLGASPSAEAAAVRSITEAVQSRISIMQGARDSFNTLSAPWRPSSPRLGLVDLEARCQVPLTSIASFSTDDLREDLRYLLDRLTEAGFPQVLAVNLSRADFGLPVVRIRVPGLTSFAVNRTRPGWRCLRYLL